MMKRLVLCLALAFAAPALATEPVFGPGASVGIAPLKDMQASKRFQGFEDPKSGASLVVIEMPKEAYAEVGKAFTDEALKAQGIASPKRETLQVGGVEGLLVSGDQTAGAATVRKWVLVANAPKVTAMVIAQMLKGESEPYTEAEIRAALTSVAFREPPTAEEQVGSLPFRLNERAGFRLVRVTGGNALYMTEGPQDTVKGLEQPVVIVASSMAGAPPVDQRDAFARRAVGGVPGLSNLRIERAQGFRQKNADWHEVVAQAKDANSDQEVVVLQAIRFTPGGYVRILGVARADVREAMLPRFRRVVDGVEVN